MKGEPTDLDFTNEDRSLLEVYINNRSLEPGTERTYFKAWCNLTDFAEVEGIEVMEIDEQRAVKFCEFLKEKGSLSENTAENYVMCLSKMVEWYTNRGVLDYNPFAMALDSDPFSYRSNTVKREVEIDELQAALQDKIQPITLTLVVLLLKTGLRISEAANLDYRDIYLDHPINEEMPTPREELTNKQDTLYVDSSISEGEIHNGELRENSNKPNSYRAIPIDDELKDVLVWYIAMSPPSPSPAEPLFRKGQRVTGERPTAKTLRERIFNPWAKANGWYDPKRSDRVTPHWCRHWFTTMLRRRIEPHEVKVGTVEDYIKGLRGDTGDDVIETYTHNWGNNQWMRDAYINNIPKLFIYD